MAQQVSIAEIMVDLMPRLERQAQSPSTVFQDFTPRLWQDCLDVLRWMTQPYPPSKYSRAQFLELRDAMHESMAIYGKYANIPAKVTRVHGMSAEDNVLVLMILDALTTAALENVIAKSPLIAAIAEIEKRCQNVRNSDMDGSEKVERTLIWVLDLLKGIPSAGG